MTTKELNKIFKKDFPTGKIALMGITKTGKHRVAVMYSSDDNIHSCTAKSYGDLLMRLGCNVICTSKVPEWTTKIADIKARLTAGGEVFLGEFFPFEGDEEVWLKDELRILEEQLTTYQIID